MVTLCADIANSRGQPGTELPVTSSHYLFVATNDEDADRLGSWPIDRSLYAKAIARAKDNGAMAVVLKFFFDRPSTTEADARLASAIASMPVYLQFAFGKEGKVEGTPVWRGDSGTENLKVFFPGAASLLPLATFREHAAGVGFVNILPDPSHDRVEILGSTGVGIGIAPSLQLLSIEADKDAHVSVHDMRLSVNHKSYEIGEDGRVACPYLNADPKQYSLLAFLDGEVPREEVTDHVIIIGNTRNDTPRYTISQSVSIPVHELFFRQILCLDKRR